MGAVQKPDAKWALCGSQMLMEEMHGTGVWNGQLQNWCTKIGKSQVENYSP